MRILPYGVGGALPNLDLVFATQLSFQSHPAGVGNGGLDRSTSIYYGNSEFLIHPFDNVANMEERLIKILTRAGEFLGVKGTTVEQYAKDLVGLMGFALGMAIGP